MVKLANVDISIECDPHVVVSVELELFDVSILALDIRDVNIDSYDNDRRAICLGRESIGIFVNFHF